jgi:PAS domain S-box-containing protein
MQDIDKTKEELAAEVAHLRQRIAELETSERERKQVEEALKRSEQEKAVLFDSISEHVVYQDTRMRVLWTNRVAGESAGIDPHQLVGHYCYEIWQQRSKPCVGCPVVKARKSGQPQEAEMTTPDGRVWFIRGYPVRDTKNNIIGAVEVTREITESKQAEEALRKSEEKYRTVVEICPDGIAIASKGCHVFANKSLAKIFGVSSPDELLGKPVMDYIHPDYRKIVRERLEQQTKGGELAPLIEEEMLRADGTVILSEVTAAPLKYEGEQAVLAVIRDITERQQAEKALKESEERFRLAFENANTGVCLVDLKGNLTKVNNRMCEIFGYTKEELESMTVNDIAHPEDIDTSPRFIRKTLKGEIDSDTFEKRYIHKKGHEVVCQISSSLVRDSEGLPLYFISHVQDITDRKKAEEGLRQSEERYKFLFENSQTINVLIGIDGKIIDVNESAAQSLGYKKKNIIGKEVLEFVIPEQRKTVAEQLAQELRGGYTPPLEIDILTKKGIRTLLFTKGYATLFEKGELTSMLLSAVDITERKKAEDELKIKNNAIASSTTAIAIGEFGGNLTYVNPALLRMWGYDDEKEVLGKPAVAFWHDQKKAQEVIKALLKSELVSAELVAERKDGSLFDVQLSASIVTDEIGNPICMMASFVDISKRKRAEEALRESEERFRTIFETAQDFIFLKDRDSKFTAVNPAMEQIYGVPASRLIGKTATVLFGKEIAVRFREQDVRVLNGETIIEEHLSPLKVSTGIHHVIKVPIRNSVGEIIGLCGIGRDITERKQMEEALRESEERFRTIVEKAGDAIIAHDLDGRVLLVNSLTCEYTGYSQEELLSMNVLDIDHEIIEKEYRRRYWEKLEIGKHVKVEATHVRKDGNTYKAELYLVKIMFKGQPIILCLARDITERKQMEEALQKSEEKYRLLADNIDVGINLIDADHTIIMANASVQKRWNKPMGTLIGKKCFRVFENRDTVCPDCPGIQTMATGQPAEVEHEEVRVDKGRFYVRLQTFPHFGQNGEVLGFTEIAEDITDRKRMEKALRESEGKYRSLVESSDDSIYLVDRNCNYIFLNNKHLSRLNVRNGQAIIGRAYGEFHTLEETKNFSQKITKVLETGMSYSYEYRSQRDNRYFIRTLSPVTSPDSDMINAVTVISKDITNIKSAEEALRESEAFSSGLLNDSPHPIIVINPDTSIRYVNPALENLTGFTASELIGRKTPYPWWPEEIVQRINRRLKGAINEGAQRVEYRFHKKSGEDFWVEITANPVMHDGEVRYLLTNWSDITERKRAEETLREREAFNYALFHYNPVETIVVDLNGRVTAFNLAKEESGDRLPTIGDRMYKDYAGKHEIDMRAELLRCIRSGESKEFPERKYGDKYLNITISPFPQGAIIISGDITDHKRAEEALRESEQFSSSLLKNAPNPIMVINPDTSIRYVNPALEKLTGFYAIELLDRKAPYPWWSDEIVSKTTEGLKQTMQQGAQRIENQFQTKNGEPFWVEITAEPVTHDGKVQFLLTNWIDITDRKQAEALLQKERDTFYSILEKAPYGVMVVDADGNHSFVNVEFTNITGYTLEDIPTTQEWLRRAYPNEQHRHMVVDTYKDDYSQREAVQKFRDRFGRMFSRVFNVVCKDGASKEIEFRTSVIGGEGNVFMLSDITDRRRIQALLETASAEWRTTFDAISDAVCLLDQHGKIIRCNNAMLRLVGKPFSQITGHHCWEVMHGVSEAPQSCPIELAGKTHHRETEVMSKDSRWFDIAVDPLLDEDGNFIGSVHLMSDITERKRIDDELKNSREQLRNLALYLETVREQERTNIAREIHDELAQALTALKMDLSWLNHRLPNDAESLIEKTKAMNTLIDSTIGTVKRISAELRPGILDDLGLVAAIEWQAEEFQNRTGIRCRVTVDPEDIEADQDRATAIFRIFQETLTNVARHARATQVVVGLKERGGKLTLRVRDNGIGITEEQISDSQSFGLIGMHERVIPWDGKISFKGIPGKGTTVIVSVELNRSTKNIEKIE